MPANATPAAEVDVDDRLVRALLADQAPELVALRLTLVASGWDNAIFRLGDGLCVRLPRRAFAAELVEHEQAWLPRLAPSLPLPVPVPMVAGRPAGGYPWSWSVCPWLDGDVALARPPDDPFAAAETLGSFVAALHASPAAGAPGNPWRGLPLAGRDERLREGVAAVHDVVDVASVLACWDELLAVSPWPGTPVLLHGDLHPANLVVHHGRLSGVIDFGDLTAGDPATDLGVAWMLLPPGARRVFRDAVGDVDDDTWARARGWALVIGIALLANSADNPAFAALGRRTVEAAIATDG